MAGPDGIQPSASGATGNSTVPNPAPYPHGVNAYIRKLEMEMEDHIARMHQAEAAAAQVKVDLAKLNARNRVLRESLDQAQKERNAYYLTVDELRKELLALKQEVLANAIKIGEADAQAKKLFTDLLEANEERVQLKQALQQMESSALDDMESVVAQLKDQQHKLVVEAESASAREKQYKDSCNATHTQLYRAQQDCLALKQQLLEAREEHSRALDALAELQNKGEGGCR
jgi:chromosome segregation ATPase